MPLSGVTSLNQQNVKQTPAPKDGTAKPYFMDFTAAAKIGASVETDPSINPASPG